MIHVVHKQSNCLLVTQQNEVLRLVVFFLSVCVFTVNVKSVNCTLCAWFIPRTLSFTKAKLVELLQFNSLITYYLVDRNYVVLRVFWLVTFFYHTYVKHYLPLILIWNGDYFYSYHKSACSKNCRLHLTLYLNPL